MSLRGKNVKVEPLVMLWARQSRGLHIDYVVEHFSGKSRERFNLDYDYLNKLERDTEEVEINFSFLKEFAALYKRPISVFFLKQPLNENFVPKNFRTLMSKKKIEFLPETLLMFRKIRNAQLFAMEVHDEMKFNIKFSYKKYDLTDNPKIVAEFFRKEFLIDESFNNKKIKKDKELFEYLRNKIEETGVLVFKSSFPLEDGRAFCFVDQAPYSIVLNNKDGDDNFYGAKIFSLVHEFAHILLRDSSMENNDFYHKLKEGFCNAFTAEFLVPSQKLAKLVKETGILDNKTTEEFDKVIKKIANHFKISRHVILRKFLDAKAVSQTFYDKKIKDWQEEYEKNKREPFYVNMPYEVKIYSSNGKFFSEIVSGAVDSNLITSTSASSLLGIYEKHYDAFRDILLHKV